ncbi:acyl-CoA dehydrogenase family protein [Nocardia tengchongensis]|uniref:acyl-CoA dehydrogenase family protein n=1 Tax=Nocardia tengchongensis TaxID=2055889 RepID=UPI0036911E02
MTIIDDTPARVDAAAVESSGSDVLVLEAILDRAIAASKDFPGDTSPEAVGELDAHAHVLVSALTFLAVNHLDAAVDVVRRIAIVSLETARNAADLVDAVAHVHRVGTPQQTRRVTDAGAAGHAIAPATRATTSSPQVHENVLAAATVDSHWNPHLILAPVDTATGLRRTALVTAIDGAVPVAGTVVDPDDLLPSSGPGASVGTLLWAAVLLGGTERLIESAAHTARDSARPWSGRTYDRLIDDPYVIVRFGRLRAELHATRRLLTDTVAGRRADRTAAAALVHAAAINVVGLVYAELPDLVGADVDTDDRLWAAARTLRRAALRHSGSWVEAIAGQSLLANPDQPHDHAGAPAGADEPVRLHDPEQAIAAATALAQSLSVDAVRRDRERAHPVAELAELARSGLLGLTVPVEFGGPGASAATVAEVVRIIATADGSVAQIFQPHFGALEVIAQSGTLEQQSFFFAEALRGARFGNANAELGTKAAGDIRTRLLHGPDGGFVVDGAKAYTTGSLHADWIPVSVRDPAGNRASALVSRHTDGVEILDDWSGIGQRTTASGSATFTGVRVFEQHVIAQWRAGEGSHLTGAKANLVHAAVNVGIAAGALAATKDYVLTKARPSKDLGIESVVEDPHVVRRFGWLAARLAVAESSLARVADLVDVASRDQSPDSISAATIAAAETEALGSEIGLEIASQLFALSGASSSRSELGLDRFWRDVRTHSLHDAMIWKYHQSGDSALSGAHYFGNRRTLY